MFIDVYIRCSHTNIFSHTVGFKGQMYTHHISSSISGSQQDYLVGKSGD